MLDLEPLPEAPPFIGSIYRSNAAVRASRARHGFGLADDFVPAARNGSRALNSWRRLLESHGFLVFQTTRVGLDVFRGLSVQHDTLPIILLNGAGSNRGKIFTLFHEVAHLANRTSGMCDLADTVGEEAVANAFSACFPMPEKSVRNVLENTRATSAELAEAVSEHFGVSTLSAAIRLKTLGLMSAEHADAVRIESDRQWKLEREARRDGKCHIPQWRIRFRDLGHEYVGTIARALEDRRVDWLDASYLLNARIPTVKQMADEYYRTEGQELPTPWTPTSSSIWDASTPENSSPPCGRGWNPPQ